MNSLLGRNDFIEEIISNDCGCKQTLVLVLDISTAYLNHPRDGIFKLNRIKDVLTIKPKHVLMQRGMHPFTAFKDKIY